MIRFVIAENNDHQNMTIFSLRAARIKVRNNAIQQVTKKYWKEIHEVLGRTL
jgi:hypothetical protein